MRVVGGRVPPQLAAPEEGDARRDPQRGDARRGPASGELQIDAGRASGVWPEGLMRPVDRPMPVPPRMNGPFAAL
jgi:hypothetical protein